MSKSKVIEHPVTQLKKQVADQQKMIEALKIDVLVLKDLLQRTVRMLAKFEVEGWPKKGPKLLK